MKKPATIRYINRSILTVHTREALLFCQGRSHIEGGTKSYWKPNIYFFGGAVNKIWANAKADDPYAEFTLIQIEKQLEKASKRLSVFERLAKRMKKRAHIPDGLDIQDCETIEPLSLPVGGKVFNTPHAKALIVLIARYDALIRQLKSLKQFNIVKNKRFHTIVRRVSRTIRSVIQESTRFQAMHVTRYDIFHKTKTGSEAIQKFGMLPLAILKRDERSAFGPTPVDSQQPEAQQKAREQA